MPTFDDFLIPEDSVVEIPTAAAAPLGLMDDLVARSACDAPATLGECGMGLALTSPKNSDISTGVTSSSSRPSSFTPARNVMIEDVFYQFTCHDRETLATQDLGMALRFLGHSLSGRQLERVIEETDKDGGGTVDFEEFLAAAEQLDQCLECGASDTAGPSNFESPLLSRAESLRNTFREFASADDSILSQNLRAALFDAGHRLTEDRVQRLATEFDDDCSGKVDLEEFLAIVERLDGESHPGVIC